MPRHVPHTALDALEDISFQTALGEALLPNPDYDSRRWLFVPCVYTEYRYILGTRGERPLICLGVNPSTAAPDRLDPTLQSVERIARSNGFDSFIMLNVSAQRATSPQDMSEAFYAPLHRENLKAFAYALSLCGRPAVWAAWGNVIETRSYLIGCVRDLAAAAEPYGAAWYCCGAVSKKGHPHHPLYLKRDEPLKPFDIGAYVARFAPARAE